MGHCDDLSDPHYLLDILWKPAKEVLKAQNQVGTASWRGSSNKIAVLQQGPGALKEPTIFSKMIKLSTEVQCLG
jgi:hypothetical protein